MSVFVNGGGDTFKYKKIVENSVENHGLGWVVPGSEIIAETSIQESDWQLTTRGGTTASYDYYINLSYVSNTNRIESGEKYALTLILRANEEIRSTRTYEVEGVAYLNNSTVVVDFDIDGTPLSLQDDGTNLRVYSLDTFNGTLKLDAPVTFNKIDSNFIDSAFIIDFDAESGTGDKTYSEILSECNSGNRPILLKFNIPTMGVSTYLQMPTHFNPAGDDFITFIGFLPFNSDSSQIFLIIVYVYEEDGDTVYEYDGSQELVFQSQIEGNILPPQTGQSGKFLTTNGSDPSWTTPNFQPKYTISATTILASGWSNGSYSAFQTTYPAASYDVNVELNGDSITSAQQKAWNAAQIVGSATTNVLKALGTVPTIDIPVIVKATPNTDTYLSDVESLLASI